MKEKLLALFKENSDNYLSGEQLSQMLGVTRAFVWKLVRALEQDGYSFDAKPRKGYRLSGNPDILTEAELSPLLHTKHLAKRIVYYPEITSTNTAARKLAEQGEPSGTVVTASNQTNGKARKHGKWVSETNSAVMLSLIFRPDFPPEQTGTFAQTISHAVCAALENIVSSPCKIGTDGGILLNGQKICGILVEFSGESDCIDYLIIGIGVNTETQSVPSILQLTNVHYSKLEVAAAVIHAIDEVIESFD